MNTLLGFAFLALLGFCTEGQSLDIYVSGVSAADKIAIVNEHNKYRLQIAAGNVTGQPKGINLLRMEWDDQLAAGAQTLADTGIFEHMIVPDDRFSVGQNLYMSMSTENSTSLSWENGIKAWFDEHQYYDYATGTSTGVTGHYTQVVWADTYLIGCGYTYFYDSTETYPFRKLYVCNYGPAGNWVGEKPYETGLSGCENLCSPPSLDNLLDYSISSVLNNTIYMDDISELGC